MTDDLKVTDASSENWQDLFTKALLEHQRGRIMEAQALYRRLRQLDPEHYDAAYLLGVACYQSGHPHDALRELQDALRLNSESAVAHMAMGSVLRSLCRTSEALDYFDKAITLNPLLAQAHNNRGNALRALGRLEEAVASYDRAIAINPDYAEAHSNRGVVLSDLKQFAEALGSYDKALLLNTHSSSVWLNRGLALRALGRELEALGDFDRAIQIDPQNADAYNTKGVSLRDLDRIDEALECYASAIKIQPAHADAHYNRGLLFHWMGRIEEAYSDFKAALSIKPDYKFLEGLALHVGMKLCDWSEFTAKVSHLEEGIREGREVSAPFPLLGLIDDPELHYQCAKIYVSDSYSTFDGPQLKSSRSTDRKKIRVGYFSADYRVHPVAHLVAELFELHDRSRFDVFGFSYGAKSHDCMRQRISSSFDKFFDIKDMSDEEAVNLARQNELDIAIDLTGHTQSNRLGLFARRCAPIQVNYLGYPGTSGAHYFDYIIADNIVIPEHNRRYFSEKVVLLPHCYQANDGKRTVPKTAKGRSEWGLPENGFVFCCFNNSWKILPETVESWASLLKKVDGSVLWLLEDNRAASQRLHEEFGSRGISSNRVIFAARVTNDQHLARHKCADLFLDTSPYNAHTTASDALWMALPVVTKIGKSFPARVAASLLNAVGLPNLVAKSQEEYEELALALAQDPSRLADIKDTLARNITSSPLFDTPRFVTGIEVVFEEMIKCYEKSLIANDLHILP